MTLELQETLEREKSERRGAILAARCVWALLGALGGIVIGGLTIFATIAGRS